MAVLNEIVLQCIFALHLIIKNIWFVRLKYCDFLQELIILYIMMYNSVETVRFLS